MWPTDQLHLSQQEIPHQRGILYLTCPKEECGYGEEKGAILLPHQHSDRCCTYNCHHGHHRLIWEPSSNTLHQAVSWGCQKLLDTPDIYSDTSPMPHLLLTSRDWARPMTDMGHRDRRQPEGVALPNRPQQKCAGKQWKRPKLRDPRSLLLWGTGGEWHKSGSTSQVDFLLVHKKSLVKEDWRWHRCVRAWTTLPEALEGWCLTWRLFLCSTLSVPLV